ncbi:hypothetical protein [Nonomuraea helvata]|uniref:Uncharacterized protein n=1 Tax=Nonomuraea helvata TaxID=37484 RepID=A0ABV5S3E9_9ACTN
MPLPPADVDPAPAWPGTGLARLFGRHSGEVLESATAELPGRQRTLHQLRSGT